MMHPGLHIEVLWLICQQLDILHNLPSLHICLNGLWGELNSVLASCMQPFESELPYFAIPIVHDTVTVGPSQSALKWTSLIYRR